jgi:hypothetical protein
MDSSSINIITPAAATDSAPGPKRSGICLIRVNQRQGGKDRRRRSADPNILVKKAGEIVEIAHNQKDGRQIAPGRSPLKDLSVYGEVGASLRSMTNMGSPMRISPAFFRSPIQHLRSLHPSTANDCVIIYSGVKFPPWRT